MIFQRLKSWRHALSFRISRQLRWSRGERHELPAGDLRGLSPAETKRIARLRDAFGVDFAASGSATTARNNYVYLDALERVYRAMGERPTPDGVGVDLGCANFWYSAALHAFFRPRRLVGIEIDGYRRYRNGHTRRDYALGYVRKLPGAEFWVADHADLNLPAELITSWFPFVTVEPLLAWRLPLSMLQPSALFASVRRNLLPDGLFVMVNQDNSEFEAASWHATTAGLGQRHALRLELALVERTQPVVVSVWQRATWQRRRTQSGIV